MKRYGVIGNGKIGSLLSQRADFVSLDCDVTDIVAVEALKELVFAEYGELDVIVNCAAKSSVNFCENYTKEAVDVNVHGTSNLHKVFGKNVLSISSDHVFSGDSLFLPDEKATPKPKNFYGFTKFAMESVSNVFGGKVIRLSRVLSWKDPDIEFAISSLKNGQPLDSPAFLYRSYIHLGFAVDGIEYMVRHWKWMPSLVNYAGTESVSMNDLHIQLAESLGLSFKPIIKRKSYDSSLIARPKKGGLNVGLSKSLGFPMYSFEDTMKRLTNEMQLL